MNSSFCNTKVLIRHNYSMKEQGSLKEWFERLCWCTYFVNCLFDSTVFILSLKKMLLKSLTCNINPVVWTVKSSICLTDCRCKWEYKEYNKQTNKLPCYVSVKIESRCQILYMKWYVALGFRLLFHLRPGHSENPKADRNL